MPMAMSTNVVRSGASLAGVAVLAAIRLARG